MTVAHQERAESPPAVKTRKKLIEVALPLEKINIASAREKSIRHGHPSTLHLWWARRPLAAARAVIFSQMVDDPSEYTDELLADPSTRQRAERELGTRRALWLERTAHQKEAAAVGDIERADPGPEPTLEATAADVERERLFRLIEQLVEWENTTNEPLLEKARAEIRRSWRRTCTDNKDHSRAAELFDPARLPAFHDPFAGGGALPLEAQRLGLEAYASDLNPVAVLINKAMIEIPPKFAGKPPVNPKARGQTGHTGTWLGAQGLAEDVRYYGQWMRDEAEKRIGHLYPKVEITAGMAHERPDLRKYVGQQLTVIAWLWARTVKSPNPAFASVDVPLASTFMLSTKPSKMAFVEPVIENGDYRFTVKVGRPKDAETAADGTKLSRGANFKCVMSGTPIASDHIYGEATAGRMSARLMAVVAEGDRGRVYLSPTPEHEAVALEAKPEWKPDVAMPQNPRWFSPPLYGLTTFGDLFTHRQLVALTTFSDLVQEAREGVQRDALAAGLPDDHTPLRDGGTGATAYTEAVGVYLACGISRSADFWSNLCIWANQPKNELVAHLFGRQAIPMAWDYAEANPFSESGGNFEKNVSYVAKSIDYLAGAAPGHAAQIDAARNTLSQDKLISTDPPYYDNIGYADLSDYFYVWLRRSLRPLFPELFATLAVPKAEELVATPYRHGSKDKAEAFFLGGMTQAMHRLAEQSHPAFPVTIYYAFKQSETETDAGTASTGWETFLAAVIRSGLAVSGTWPMRTERTQGLKGLTNALASSIILVCRPRTADARSTRREFVTALKAELPQALAHLQRGNIAPVDLAQAAIGPGMAVYSRYAKVLDAQGQPLAVREALALINDTLDEALAKQEGDFDADSRWALTWYEQHGFSEGRFGMADDLARARNTSVEGMKEAGILASGGGIVRLLRPTELNSAWDPATDRRRPAWQAVHQLIQAAERGETALAELIAKLGPEAEIARELAYRLYVLSERKKRTQEALWYNGLVQSWPEAVRLTRTAGPGAPEQQQLFDAG